MVVIKNIKQLKRTDKNVYMLKRNILLSLPEIIAIKLDVYA